MKHIGKINKKEEALVIEGLESPLYLDSVRDENVADACLTALYDFHQMADHFKDGDTIEVVGVGTFNTISYEIEPATEEMMERGKKPYKIKYEGMDGVVYENFRSLALAAKYIKERWQGIDYCSNRTNFHNDYGQFYLTGFTLEDIGNFTGTGSDREFTFGL